MPIIQSVQRALNILDLFDEFHTELKITEISSRLGLNKSTTHAILNTLKSSNYIKQDSETGKYSLGIKLLERGNFVMNSMDIRALAKRYLIELSKETGNTTHLVVLDGKSGVYIDKVEGLNKTIVFSRIGRRVPIHSSAVGKVLVAFKSKKDVAYLLDSYDFFVQTAHTITNKETYLEELQKVATQGFATDQEENEDGVYCIAVPVYDHSGSVIAAISMSFALSMITEETKVQTVKRLKESALLISQQMGYLEV